MNLLQNKVSIVTGAGSGIGRAIAAGYVAAKHGVTGLTEAAALDYADQKIRINSMLMEATWLNRQTKYFNNNKLFNSTKNEKIIWDES
jgi:NAD(P)-dependent dehydrogenase (short-subunit alcohol dehydrogenase family)